MAKEILKCIICDNYTLQSEHCNQKTISIKPAKYSPLDKYGQYRRRFKQLESKNVENKSNC